MLMKLIAQRGKESPAEQTISGGVRVGVVAEIEIRRLTIGEIGDSQP